MGLWAVQSLHWTNGAAKRAALAQRSQAVREGRRQIYIDAPRVGRDPVGAEFWLAPPVLYDGEA